MKKTQVQSSCRDAITTFSDHPRQCHSLQATAWGGLEDSLAAHSISSSNEVLLPVMLSAAKNPAWRVRFFAALRMTLPGVIGKGRNRGFTQYTKPQRPHKITFPKSFVPLFLNW